jgi:glycosyltransferase involved in cell wall biosynthesis
MAIGTPCIATEVTGIPEVIKNGETGILLPEREPCRLADSLAGLLADPSLGRRLAIAARRLIESAFDVDQNTAQLRRLISEGNVTSGPLLAEAV